eukprot:scaffold191783_cov25-Tisochrysis_lutea.AAC.4
MPSASDRLESSSHGAGAPASERIDGALYPPMKLKAEDASERADGRSKSRTHTGDISERFESYPFIHEKRGSMEEAAAAVLPGDDAELLQRACHGEMRRKTCVLRCAGGVDGMCRRGAGVEK